MISKFILWPLVVITFVLPVIAWVDNTGGIVRLFDIHEPPGQSWYLLSRLFGVLALSSACWQFVLGLSRRYRNPLFSRQVVQRRVHALLGMVTFLLFWAHALCFVSAVSIRKGHFAYGLLLPNLGDYYHSVISIGWLALVLVSVAVLARIFKVGNQHVWHKLVYAVLPLAIGHSLLVGTDTRDALMIVNYGLLILIWFTTMYCAFFSKKIYLRREGVV